MMRRLLMTTAIALIATSGSMAAGTQDTTMTPAPMSDQQYVQNIGHGLLASDLIGKTVYTSEADDGELVGEINDLVIGEDGSVEAVVLGVGGFLGIGEKDVAVNFEDVRWAEDAGGTRFAVYEASRESLMDAPAFERATAMAPAEEPMTGEDTAMAPADNENMEPVTEDTAMAPVDPNQTADEKTDPMMPQMTEVTAGSISGEQLIGATVYARDDENVGEVGDVRLSTDGGQVDAVIVDVGGFLGIGEKPVAIAFDSLVFKKDEGGTFYIYTDFTREELESAPDYDAAAYDDERESMRLTLLRQ